MPFLSVPALSGWLGILFAKCVVTTIPPTSLWSEMQAKQIRRGDMPASPWTAADPVEDEALTKTLSLDSEFTDSPSRSEDFTAYRYASTSLPVEFSKFLPTEVAHDNVASAPPSPHKSNRKRRGLLPAFGAAALLFLACLGLLALVSTWVVGRRNARERSNQKQMQQTYTSGHRSLVQQLNELEEMQPLAAWLAEIVDSPESLGILQSLRKSIENAKQVQQEILAGSLSYWDSRVKDALDRGVSDLSHLFELTRMHGLSLAQEIRELPASPNVAEQELAVLRQADKALTESLAFHLENLDFSCRSFKHYAAKAEEELQALSVFKGLDDRMVLSAIAADVEFIQAAHEALEVGRRSATGLASTAHAVVMSYAVREQLHIHRECRDILQERRAQCSAEKQRQQSLPEEDTAVLNKLDELDDMLSKGEQLLQVHRAEIEHLQKRIDGLSVQADVQQAEMVGQELKDLLEAVACHVRSIAGMENAKESDESGWAQKSLEAVASRASEHAAATSERVTDILTKLQSRGLFPSPSGTAQMHEQESSLAKTIVNPTMLKLVTESLQQLEDSAKGASLHFSNAAAVTTTGLEAATKKAAVATEEIAAQAEMLRLHLHFLESLETDMQLSWRMAQRAAALAGAGTKEIHQEALPAVELSPPKRKQLVFLLHQVNTVKAAAMSQWTLADLAAAAVTMKGAALGLALTVKGHHPSSRLYIKH